MRQPRAEEFNDGQRLDRTAGNRRDDHQHLVLGEFAGNGDRRGFSDIRMRQQLDLTTKKKTPVAMRMNGSRVVEAQAAAPAGQAAAASAPPKP